MTKNIQLSDHFNYKKLILFSLAPICSMVFTSLYGIVDGYFVSNNVGSTAFASLNLVMPFIMLLAGVGFMFGSGGSALVALHLGMEEKDKANRYFSLIVYSTLVVGIVLGIIGYVFSEQVSILLGATKQMLPYCVLYLQINMIGNVTYMLQTLFQTFLITAEKPKLGFKITLIAGFTNMILDWLFVGVLKFGLAGAAWATVTSQLVGSVIPFVLFIIKKDWIIHLGKTKFEFSVIKRTCGNGVSEFLSSVSMSLVGFLYNLQLLNYAGENGVSAYGVIMYVSFIFIAIYIGYNMGVAPVISYNDGARNTDELKSLYKKSLRILLISNIIMFLLAEVLAFPLSNLFVGYDKELCDLTIKGLRIYSIAFLAMGFNIFSSAFFTALNNGKISAILSVSRTLILQVIMIYLLPTLFGADALWAVIVAVEGIGLILTFIFFMKFGKKYGYR